MGQPNSSYKISINQGIRPDKLEIGLNHTLFTKETQDQCAPISILPLFSEVFEKLMYNRPFDFIETKKHLA